MKLTAFWNLIDSLADQAEGVTERLEDLLMDYLTMQDPDFVQGFHEHMMDSVNQLNTVPVFEAASLIGTASHSGWQSFRKWIVLQGKDLFDDINSSPDCLGDHLPNTDPIESWYSEFDVQDLYASMTGGEELSNLEIEEFPQDPSHEEDANYLANAFPRLWARMESIRNRKIDQVELANQLFADSSLDSVVDENGAAWLTFSTGTQISIKNYWERYRELYNIESKTPDYSQHPMVGAKVFSIDAEYFPDSFHIWFSNRRKLVLSHDMEFRVFGPNEKS